MEHPQFQFHSGSIKREREFLIELYTCVSIP